MVFIFHFFEVVSSMWNSIAKWNIYVCVRVVVFAYKRILSVFGKNKRFCGSLIMRPYTQYGTTYLLCVKFLYPKKIMEISYHPSVDILNNHHPIVVTVNILTKRLSDFFQFYLLLSQICATKKKYLPSFIQIRACFCEWIVFCVRATSIKKTYVRKIN